MGMAVGGALASMIGGGAAGATAATAAEKLAALRAAAMSSVGSAAGIGQAAESVNAAKGAIAERASQVMDIANSAKGAIGDTAAGAAKSMLPDTLNSPWARILLSGSPYMQSVFKEEQDQRRADAYKQVAYETGQMMKPGEYGPPKSAMSPTGITPEFAMRVAGLPGYQQLGASMLSDLGAAGREAAARIWSQNNMTASDAAQLAQRVAEAKQAQDWRQYAFEHLSADQKAMLGLQREGQNATRDYQNRSLQQGKDLALLGYGMGPLAQGMPAPNPYPKPGSKEYDAQLLDLQSMADGVRNIEKLRDLWNSANWGALPWGDSKEAMGKAEPIKQAVIGAMGKAMNTGALQKADVDMFLGSLNEPGIFSSSTRRNAALDSLKERMMHGVDNVYERNPNLPQILPPEGYKPPKPPKEKPQGRW